MSDIGIDEAGRENYAMRVLEDSFAWYQRAAKRARRFHRLSEVTQVSCSAAIPLAAVVFEGNTFIPAVLGAVLVLVAGLRSIFHWSEDYLRFSQTREALEAERRLYKTGATPYASASQRDRILVQNVSAIEQAEMGGWLEIARPRRRAEESAE